MDFDAIDGADLGYAGTGGSCGALRTGGPPNCGGTGGCRGKCPISADDALDDASSEKSPPSSSLELSFGPHDLNQHLGRDDAERG